MLCGKTWVRLLVLVAAGGVLSSAQAPAPAAKKPAARKAKHPRDYRQGEPLELEQLVVIAKGLPAETVVGVVRARKLAFIATDENVARMRAAGLPEAVIEAAREVSPPPAAPPPPPKPTTGVVSVSCVPKECSVQVGSGSPEATNAGILRKTVPLGKHVVLVSRAGYATERREVDVAPEGARIEVALKPDAATKRQIGYAIFDRMAQAIGDENAEVLAVGSWSVQKAAGLPQEWTLRMRISANAAEIGVTGAGRAYQMECSGESCQSEKPQIVRGKELKGADAAKLDAELRAFRRHNLTRLIGDMKKGRATSYQASAEGELPGGDGFYHVKMEGPADSYEITLDQRYLPRTIVCTSKAGTPPIRLTYDDYQDMGKVRYPKRTLMKFDDPNVGVITVRLDQFPPSLR